MVVKEEFFLSYSYQPRSGTAGPGITHHIEVCNRMFFFWQTEALIASQVNSRVADLGYYSFPLALSFSRFTNLLYIELNTYFVLYTLKVRYIET